MKKKKTIYIINLGCRVELRDVDDELICAATSLNGMISRDIVNQIIHYAFLNYRIIAK